jgi:hypothetical protein
MLHANFFEGTNLWNDVLDGLYANGPVIALCRRYKWDFMIVLKDDSLPSVWEEFHGLSRLQTGQSLQHHWSNRRQDFRWVNQIEYGYGLYGRYKQTVHVVLCEESWEDIDPKTGAVITITSCHAWLSGKPLSIQNVVRRCNQMGRYRWKIENNILKEKHHGYQYEHCFSYNWNAMKGFHYLMRLGHLLNTLAQKSVYLIDAVRLLGMRGLVQFIRDTLTGPWLDAERIRHLFDQPHQLRLA